MRKSEKELKQEFENKKSETEKLAQKINIVIWKVKRPQDIKQADKIINKYKKILCYLFPNIKKYFDEATVKSKLCLGAEASPDRLIIVGRSNGVFCNSNSRSFTVTVTATADKNRKK